MVAAFDSVGPLVKISALIGNLTGMQRVYEGVPGGLSPRGTAWVALAGMVIEEFTTSQLVRTMRYQVGFGYRVGGNEQGAELIIGGWVDEFCNLFYADRRLSGTVDSAKLDLSLADTPEYRSFAAQEIRIYPIIVECIQRVTYVNVQGP